MAQIQAPNSTNRSSSRDPTRLYAPSASPPDSGSFSDPGQQVPQAARGANRLVSSGVPTPSRAMLSLPSEPGAGNYQPAPFQFDVFVSFSSADRVRSWFDRNVDVVAELKSTLERYRHPVTSRRLRACTYEEDFELGDDVRGTIARTIGQCAALVFLSGKGAAASKFVRFELETARAILDEDAVVPALLDEHPHVAFPDLFAADAHGADLSRAGCADHREWIRRVELEAAKIAARAWRMPLERVRDRFRLEQRRNRNRRLGALAIVTCVLGVSAGAAYHQYGLREAARVLGIHQRYAAAMATVQRAWSAGNVELVRTALLGWQTRPESPDPRSFEWHSYSLVATAEHGTYGEFGNDVTALAAARSEPWFAFATATKPVTIWDATNGAQIARLSPATIASSAITFASDGTWLAALAKSHIVRWDRTTGVESTVASPPGDELVALATSPTDLFAVGRRGNLYRLRGDAFVLSEPSLFQVKAHFKLASSDSGRFLVGVGDGSNVQVVDATTATLAYTKAIPEYRSGSFAISGESAFFTSADRVTQLDLAARELHVTQRLSVGLALAGVAASNDGRLMAVGDPSNSSIVLWHSDDIDVSRALRDIGAVKGYSGWLDTVRFLPRSTLLVASSLAGDVKVWDMKRIGRRVVRYHARDIVAVGFVENSHDVVSLDGAGMVRRWNARTLTEQWVSRTTDERISAVARRGRHLAVAGNGVIRLLRLDDGQEDGSISGWEPLASAQGGALFAFTTDASGEVVVEDVVSGSRRTFRVESASDGKDLDITSMTFTKSAEALLIATADGRVLCFDLGTNRRVWSISAHGRVIYAIAAAPSGTHFATASSDKTVRLWRTSDGAAAGVLDGHAATVQTLAYSADGKTLASGSQDGIVKLWNVHARIETVTFNSHARDLHPGVRAVAFSNDGSHLVTAGARGTVIVWDTDARAVIPELSAPGK